MWLVYLPIRPGYASGVSRIDVAALEAAKSSVIFEQYIERVATGPAAAQQSLFSYFRGTPPTFESDLVQSVLQVSEAAVVGVISTFLSRLFDVNQSIMVACVNSSKGEAPFSHPL